VFSAGRSSREARAVAAEQRSAKARSLHCCYCGVNWPPEDEFNPCPVCLEPTQSSHHDSIAIHAAEIELAHSRFGWWLYDNGRV